MTTKRRLEDLYVRGRELPVDDGSGDPVVVWVHKLSPLDHEKAIRKASAARAQVVLSARSEDSEEWQEAYADVLDLGKRDVLVDYLLAEDLARAQESTEAELSFGEEWTKDGYLQGLRDSWEDPEGSLRDRYATDPDDEDARRVFLELKRFADQVDAQVAPELERLRRDYQDVPEDQLRQQAVARFVELRSGMLWLREFHKSQIFFGTRDVDDHNKRYFAHRDQVDTLAPEVFQALLHAFDELMVEPAEGKDSPRTPSSSPSSEPQNAAVT